jgi:uncharacterized protein (TIGR03437 family)
VTVTVNGEPAFIEYISPVQINLITPADMPTSGQLQVQVQVSNNGLTNASIGLTAQPLAPSGCLHVLGISARHHVVGLFGVQRLAHAALQLL